MRRHQQEPTGNRFARRLAIFYASSFLVLGVHMPFMPVWLAASGLDPKALVHKLLDAIDSDTIEREALARQVSPEAAAEALKEEACRPFDDPALRRLLKDIKRQTEIRIDTISTDAVISSGYDAASAQDRHCVPATSTAIPQRVERGDASAHQRTGVNAADLVRNRRQSLEGRHHEVLITAIHRDASDLLVRTRDEAAAAARFAVTAISSEPSDADALPRLPPRDV